MRTSELIAALQASLARDGDLEVAVSCNFVTDDLREVAANPQGGWLYLTDKGV